MGGQGALRVGLIGVNERARRLLLPGLRKTPRATLAAVCSRDLEKAQRTAAEIGIGVRAFGDVREMVESGDVDAVYVNTPAETHFDICMAAIEGGQGVICEKPLTERTAQARQLLEAAEQAGVGTAVNFTYRSVPAFRLTERLLAEPLDQVQSDEDGADQRGLGRPVFGSFELLQGHNFLPDFRHGSALRESGAHLFDTLLGLCARAGFGRPAAVSATAMREEDGMDHGWAFLVQMTSGAQVSATFSRGALGWRNGLRWRLYGDARAIEAETDGAQTSVRTVARGDGRPQGTWREVPLPADIADDDARFAAFHMDRLAGAVLGQERFPGFAEAAQAHLLADALVRSAQDGGWVVVA